MPRRTTFAHLRSRVLLVTLALVPALTLGQSLRCGSELITQGTSQAKVAALCGQPAQVVRPPVADGIVPGVSDVEEETWIYNFGPNRLMQRIRFRNGKVASIDTIGYGY
jgi:Protein of unknown function (DUF2845)